MYKHTYLITVLVSLAVSTNLHKENEEFRNKYHENDVLLLDVDAGVDDALAILLALKAEELKIGPPVIGITCVNGNTQLKNVVVNVQRTLQLAGRQDIPVFAGLNSSLVFQVTTDSAYGKDGFGDIPYDPETLVPAQSKHAVNALIELVDKYAGRIVVAAIGPLTNIAMAERMHPGLLAKLKTIVIMGGSSTGVGNIKPGIEFNAYFDVEAYHIVLSNTNYKRAMILTWDPVVAAGIPREWWEKEILSANNSWTNFLKDIGNIYDAKHPILYHADPAIYAVYLQPKIKLESKPLKVQPVTDGAGRGAFLIDYYHADRNIEQSNLEVIQKLDLEEYKQFLVYMLTGRLDEVKTFG